MTWSFYQRGTQATIYWSNNNLPKPNIYPSSTKKEEKKKIYQKKKKKPNPKNLNLKQNPKPESPK